MKNLHQKIVTKNNSSICIFYMFAFVFFILPIIFIENDLEAKSIWPVSKKEQLVIINDAGKEIKFDLEIADDDLKRSKGLMYRTDIKDNYAMIFVYEKEKYISMWMKNTPTSLDMAFIGKNGKIINIVENTTPYSLDSISSKIPAKAVIEVKAGIFRKNNIKSGNIVKHKLFNDSK